MIKNELNKLYNELPSTVKLVAVSKFNPVEAVKEAYDAGQRVFGESRPQEFYAKVPQLPKDIQWHFIGHLQTNKLKMVLPFVHLIESVDSEKLLMAIDKYAVANGLRVRCLLEVFVAEEVSKQGFSEKEIITLFNTIKESPLEGVEICGLMGMATFTDNKEQLHREFTYLSSLFSRLQKQYSQQFPNFNELSMGMSGDYKIAIECGSTAVRIGTRIFGARNY